MFMKPHHLFYYRLYLFNCISICDQYKYIQKTFAFHKRDLFLKVDIKKSALMSSVNTKKNMCHWQKESLWFIFVFGNKGLPSSGWAFLTWSFGFGGLDCLGILSPEF